MCFWSLVFNILFFLARELLFDYQLPITNYSHRKRGGFTLIELLVVAGIISVLTGIGVASYNNFNEKQKVSQAAEQLRVNLRKAQSNAISGIKDSSCSNKSLKGWYVDFANKEYYGECDGTEFPSPKKKLLEGSFSLTLSPSIPSSKILFKPMIGDTNLSSSLTITLKPSGATSPQATVTVSVGGEIK